MDWELVRYIFENNTLRHFLNPNSQKQKNFNGKGKKQNLINFLTLGDDKNTVNASKPGRINLTAPALREILVENFVCAVQAIGSHFIFKKLEQTK